MSFKLYTRKSTGGMVVEAALAKAGVAFEAIEVDTKAAGFPSPGFLAVNPMAQVPALILPDGSLMTESAAIVLHLADLYPQAGLAPPAGTLAHAQFLRWVLFMATNIYEADLRYFYPERYTTEPAGAAGIKAAAAARMQRCFGVIEPALAPWLAGEMFSIADVYLAMLVSWAPGPVASAKLTALCAKVAADPIYGPIWARHV